MRIALDRLRINPLGLVSGTLLILAPFGSWMTLSAFGYVSTSNLWQIAGSETSFPIGGSVPSIALYSGILLIIAGLATFTRKRIGPLLGTVAVLIFGLSSYSSYGIFPGVIPVSILPGIGFFLGTLGVISGIGSLRTAEQPLSYYLATFKTRLGLGETGIVVASIFLGADGWTHWSVGALSGFLGVGIIEGAIHRAFFVGVGCLLLIFLVNKSLILERNGGVLVVATFGALLLDVVYHSLTGSVIEFVGHDADEVLFHALSYYGVVSLVIARFLLRQR